MSHGFGRPPHRDYQLPMANAVLAPLQPSAVSPLLPLPNKAPGLPHYVGSQSLAQYKSPWLNERLPQGHRQDGLDHRSPVAHPPNGQEYDRERITHGGDVDRRITIPLHSYSHDPRKAHEATPAHSPYQPVGPGGDYPRIGDSRLQPTYSPHDDKVHGKVAPSTTSAEQSNRPNTATDMSSDSPWGYTKAGKLRKRLEQACVSCRKKKTKCEPISSSSKCSLCDKSGSECYFDNPLRTRRHAPSAHSSSPISPALALPSFERQDSSSSSRRGQRSNPASDSISSSRSSMDIGNLLSPSSPAEAVGQGELGRGPPHKRTKHGMALPNTVPREASNALQHKAPGTRPEPARHYSPIADTLGWDVDPFEAMPDMTEHYLGHYFTNINTTSYCMYPRERFLEWVRRDREKTQAEKMLLYAMLAHGSVFSGKAAKTGNTKPKFFENIAREAMSKHARAFSLPMVQTRLILALLHHALGNGFRAWDYCGMAIRAACGMKLNVEKGLHCITAGERPDFGFDRPTLIECRRRTFWSAYIMDRYSGFVTGHLCMLQNGNCILRLPCDDNAYARGKIPKTPFFHTPIVDPKLSLETDRSGLGMMAYFVEVSAIWDDVLAQAYRSEYQPASQYGEPAEEFHQQQMARLDRWKAGLGAHLHPGQDNIDRAFHGGYIGGFVSLWMLYHCTAIKLCRHVRFQYMQREHIERNLTQARHHAHEILRIMPSLAKANRERRMPESAFTVSTPFMGYAIFTSVDVLTAAGSLAEFPSLLELLSSGTEVVEELAQYWSSAMHQWRRIGERFESLLNAVREGAKDAKRGRTEKTAFYTKTPMGVTFSLEHDLIYDAPLVHRMRVIGLEELIGGGDELIEIKLQKQDAPPEDLYWSSMELTDLETQVSANAY